MEGGRRRNVRRNGGQGEEIEGEAREGRGRQDIKEAWKGGGGCRIGRGGGGHCHATLPACQLTNRTRVGPLLSLACHVAFNGIKEKKQVSVY